MDNSWIFAHRGFWNHNFKPNSTESLTHAGQIGFSVETDIRDYLGDIVIEHDAFVVRDDTLKLEEMTELMNKTRFALNVKSDGLQMKLLGELDSMKLSKSFVFDASLPQLLQYKNLSIPTGLRLSEYEQALPWSPDVVWVDSFENEWWIDDYKIEKLIDKFECIFVSPELHGRDYRQAWDWILRKKIEGNENVSICTDHPNEIMKMATP
jgi:hypothetical protein